MGSNLNDISFFMKAGKKPFISGGLAWTLGYILVIISDFSKDRLSLDQFGSVEGYLYLLKAFAYIYFIPAIIFIWFLGFRVIIEDGVLIYKTLFGIKELHLENISKYNIQHGYNGWNNLRKPYFRLEIFGKRKKEPDVMLNLNVFGNSDCKQLFDILKKVVEFNEVEKKK